MRIGLHGPHDLYALRYLAEHEIKRELEALAGVAAVKIKGGLEEEIHVALNERQISVMGLDINQINNRLAQNNVNLPGGNLREGQVEYLIRTLNEFATVDEIAELIVARQGDADIYLRDIAEVVRSHKDREIITRVNGKESVEIEIYKEGDANIVAVAERVRNTLFGLPEQREYVEQKAREAQEMAQRSEEQKKQEGEETKKKQEAEKAAGKKERGGATKGATSEEAGGSPQGDGAFADDRLHRPPPAPRGQAGAVVRPVGFYQEFDQRGPNQRDHRRDDGGASALCVFAQRGPHANRRPDDSGVDHGDLRADVHVRRVAQYHVARRTGPRGRDAGR